MRKIIITESQVGLLHQNPENLEKVAKYPYVFCDFANDKGLEDCFNNENWGKLINGSAECKRKITRGQDCTQEKKELYHMIVNTFDFAKFIGRFAEDYIYPLEIWQNIVDKLKIGDKTGRYPKFTPEEESRYGRFVPYQDRNDRSKGYKTFLLR